jgi:ribose/xylose/arabinose/galactoside ABC-type transport system permease subunit
MGSAKGLQKFLQSKMLTLLIILVFVIVVFVVWTTIIGKNFLTADTAMSIIDSIVCTSFLAIGSGALLLTGTLDLSVVAVGASGGVFFAMMMKTWLLPTPVALILTLAVCGLFGVFNAVLINEFNMQPFIATMGTSYIIGGLRQWITWDPATMSAQNFNYTNDFTKFVGTYNLFKFIPFTVLLMAVFFIVYGVMLRKTKFGNTVYLVGGNRTAARLSGLNPKKISYIMFINNAVLVGIAGIVTYCRNGLASQAALGSAMFTGLIAAMIGGISFFGGSGGMGGVFIGLCILQTFTKGMTIVNFDAYWTPVVQGLLFVLALSFDIRNVKKVNKSLNKKEKKTPEKIAAGRGV